jgi:hypothetical protein
MLSTAGGGSAIAIAVSSADGHDPDDGEMTIALEHLPMEAREAISGGGLISGVRVVSERSAPSHGVLLRGRLLRGWSPALSDPSAITNSVQLLRHQEGVAEAEADAILRDVGGDQDVEDSKSGAGAAATATPPPGRVLRPRNSSTLRRMTASEALIVAVRDAQAVAARVESSDSAQALKSAYDLSEREHTEDMEPQLTAALAWQVRRVAAGRGTAGDETAGDDGSDDEGSRKGRKSKGKNAKEAADEASARNGAAGGVSGGSGSSQAAPEPMDITDASVGGSKQAKDGAKSGTSGSPNKKAASSKKAAVDPLNKKAAVDPLSAVKQRTGTAADWYAEGLRLGVMATFKDWKIEALNLRRRVASQLEEGITCMKESLPRFKGTPREAHLCFVIKYSEFCLQEAQAANGKGNRKRGRESDERDFIMEEQRFKEEKEKAKKEEQEEQEEQADASSESPAKSPPKVEEEGEEIEYGCVRASAQQRLRLCGLLCGLALRSGETIPMRLHELVWRMALEYHRTEGFARAGGGSGAPVRQHWGRGVNISDADLFDFDPNHHMMASHVAMVAKGIVRDTSTQPPRWKCNWSASAGTGSKGLDKNQLASLQTWFEQIMAGEGALTFSLILPEDGDAGLAAASVRAKGEAAPAGSIIVDLPVPLHVQQQQRRRQQRPLFGFGQKQKCNGIAAPPALHAGLGNSPILLRGREVEVTEQNTVDFAQALARYFLRDSILGSLSAFCEGLYRVIPSELLEAFSPKELQLLACGPVEVSVQELRRHSRVKGYTPDCVHLQWFWKVLESLTHVQRRRLLGFVTGKDSLPIGGAADLVPNFTITRGGGTSEHLPQAHTCSSELVLPVYDTEEQMRARLLFVVEDASSMHFGFA